MGEDRGSGGPQGVQLGSTCQAQLQSRVCLTRDVGEGTELGLRMGACVPSLP